MMTVRTRHTAALGPAAALGTVVLALLCTQSASGETVAPLPASAYTTQAACAPPAPGYAACLALQLVPATAEARARTHPLGVTRHHAVAAASAKEGDYGLTPGELHSAYELPTTAGTTQTIALIDAFNDPTAASDLKAYEKEFGLEACKEASCFRQVSQVGSETKGSLPFPKTVKELKEAKEAGRAAEAEEAEGWDVEISLDIEAARATCESCHILLVEANSSSYENLATAEDWAAEHGGAQEISNSWGGSESAASATTSAFDHPGIVITAAAGDDGYLSWLAKNSYERGYANFPASSPDVVAVGGTRLERIEGKWQAETVWNDGGETKGGSPDGYGAGGSGCSDIFTAPPWQQSVSDWREVGCASKRAVADVAADGDPYTGFALYDTTPAPEESSTHWYTYGGTSLASPIIASAFALASGAGTIEYPAETLYQNEKLHPASLHDIGVSTTSGSNGKCSEPFNEATGLTGCTPEREAKASCSKQLICLAHVGYDGPTGVGTPNGVGAFKPLSAEEADALAEIEAEEKAQAEARSREEQLQAEAERELEKEQREAAEKSKSEASSGASGASAGGSSISPSVLAPAAPQVTTTSPPPTTVARISRLALTLKALLALNHSRPKLSQVGFMFTLNLADRVSVTLAKRVRAHGQTRWVSVRRAITFAALAGLNVHSMSGRVTLSTGTYRLTLTPSHGTASSLVFKLG